MQPGGPSSADTRNVILAVVLSAAILFGFEFFYNAPQRQKLAAQEQARIETQVQAQPRQATTDAPAAAPATAPREQVLAASADARIVIDTPRMDGSIALRGGRLDDISLKDYRRTTERGSPEVTVLSPYGSPHAHDAYFGWEMQRGETVSTLADAASGWSAPQGARLTPETPVTLTLDAGAGVTIERTISVDNDFMLTLADVVHNTSADPVSVRPLGVVRREGMPDGYVFNGIVHQGLIGFFGPDNRWQHATFKEADQHARDRGRGRVGQDERIEEQQGRGGWLGITDHYWLAAIVPEKNEQTSTYFDSRAEGAENSYRAAYRGQWREAPAGGAVSYTQRVFAGAKQVDVLQRYQSSLNIPHFDAAVDWGNFWFLTRPFFALLHWLAQFAGSFAIGILLSTIVVKAIMFPLVYQSFKAMAKMRALQPKMKEIQERYAADKQRQQQETLKLYQTEKINPVSGCVPILLQIPVFFALYKVLTNTIEMRHAPFFGWVHDLSARDPTSLFNLFGLLPYDVPAFLLIGVWPILYGVSMFLLQSLSQPPTDEIQAQIMRFLPILFTFMFAAFPAGLVIYWTWSNSITMLQQYFIMRRQGVETQLDKFLAKRRAAAAE